MGAKVISDQEVDSMEFEVQQPEQSFQDVPSPSTIKSFSTCLNEPVPPQQEQAYRQQQTFPKKIQQQNIYKMSRIQTQDSQEPMTRYNSKTNEYYDPSDNLKGQPLPAQSLSRELFQSSIENLEQNSNLLPLNSDLNVFDNLINQYQNPGQISREDDDESHHHKLTKCQKFKYLVGCGVRLQTLVIGYFFLFVETSNMCLVSDQTIKENRPMNFTEIYNYREHKSKDIIIGYGSWDINMLIMSQFLLSLVTSAAYFWKVQTSIKYQDDEDEESYHNKTDTAKNISNLLLFVQGLYLALGPLIFLEQTFRICSGFSLDQSDADSIMQEYQGIYVRKRCMFLTVCGSFGFISFIAMFFMQLCKYFRKTNKVEKEEDDVYNGINT